MKRIKLTLGNGLRKAMLVLALLGGSYFAKAMTGEARIKIGFTIALGGAMTKKGIKLEAGEKDLVDALDVELNTQLKAWMDENSIAFLTEKTFNTFMTAKAADIVKALNLKDNIKIGEGDAAKTLEEHLRIMAGDITKAAQTAIQVQKQTLKTLVDENMDAIEKVFRSKTQGASINISLKAAAITATNAGGTLDPSALEDHPEIIDNFRVDAFVPKRYPMQFIYDIANRVTTSELPEHIIWWEEGDSEGAIALTAEGAIKPLVQIKLVENFSKYKKATGKIVFTEEFAKFRKRAYAIINTLFNQKVNRDYQNILTAELIAAAAPYVASDLDGTITAPTDFDAIGAVASQIESLEFRPDVLIINPNDKWRMVLSKDAFGQYYTTVITQGIDGTPVILGYRVVVTNKITKGYFMLGEGGLWSIEEEAVQMRMGYGISIGQGDAVESDFDTNRFRIIGEVFFHSYIASNNEGSFVYANFAAVKQALLLDEVEMP